MKKVTSKRAQATLAKSLTETLGSVHWDIHTLSEDLSDLEMSVKKKKNMHAFLSLEDLLGNCKANLASVNSQISQLKMLSLDEDDLKDLQQQYNQLNQEYKELKPKVEKLIGIKSKDEEDEDIFDIFFDDDEAEEDDDWNEPKEKPKKKSQKKPKSTKSNYSNVKSEPKKEEETPSASELEKQYIRNLSFDTQNVDKLITQLQDLNNEISVKILSFSLTKNNYKIAKSKFEEGLSLLQSLDSNHKMVKFLADKISKWDEINKQNNIKKVVIWSGIGVGGIALLVFGL